VKDFLSIFGMPASASVFLYKMYSAVFTRGIPLLGVSPPFPLMDLCDYNSTLLTLKVDRASDRTISVGLFHLRPLIYPAQTPPNLQEIIISSCAVD
jgi:hypothetical protein